MSFYIRTRMTNNREVLLKLVRIALGWENDLSLPDNINWAEVTELSSEQGVATILLDGYEEYLRSNPEAKSFLSFPENKPIKGKVLNRLNNTELNYLNQLASISILSEVLSKEHIPFLVMKGFSCAQYYPIPNHRDCGDIDIYPGANFTKSNDALRSCGFDVDMHYYRHSVSEIKCVNIENHRVLCDLRGPRRQTRALESQLEIIANDCLQQGGEVVIDDVLVPYAVFPSSNFNALFLPWHVSAHFEFERVTIRHLLDWALFLSHEGNSIDIELFRAAKRKYTYGYSKFADILTYLSIRYLNMPVENIPSSIVDDAMAIDKRLADLVFEYMFTGKPRERDANVWKFRLNNIKRIWKERWKYRKLYQMSVFSFMYHKITGVLFGVGESE